MKNVSSVFHCEVNEFQEGTARHISCYCVTGLFKLKFHLMDHLRDNLEKFGTIGLAMSPFKHFHVFVKLVLKKTSFATR